MRVTAFLAVVLSLAISARAQSNVGIELDEVTDNRVSMGDLTGFLSLRVKLTGTGIDKALAARVIVKEAKDDRGTSLSDGTDKPDFFPRDYNSGTLSFSVKQPVRDASSVRLKGTIELYVPSRDPAAIVKVSKALSKLDTPLTAAGLKTAKLTITPLSTKGYAAQLESHKLDDKKIAELRAEGKKHGASDEEIDKLIGLAKAMEGLNEQPQEGMVILSGTKADFDRIYRVEILGDDGKPVDVGSRSTSTRGDDATLMTMQPQKPPPANAALEFYVLTGKSTLSFPFDLKVTLP